MEYTKQQEELIPIALEDVKDLQEARARCFDRLVRFRLYLQQLPQFDRARKARENQGDIPAVYEAGKLWHSIKERLHQARCFEVARHEVFSWPEWINYDHLRKHTARSRESARLAEAERRSKLSLDDRKAASVKRAQRRHQQRTAEKDEWFALSLERFISQLQAVPGFSTCEETMREIKKRWPDDPEEVGRRYAIVELWVAIRTYWDDEKPGRTNRPPVRERRLQQLSAATGHYTYDRVKQHIQKLGKQVER